MTRVDLHPEDLFDALREGGLREEERQRLLQHCAHCGACRFELSLLESTRPELQEPSEDDHVLGSAAVDRLWGERHSAPAVQTTPAPIARGGSSIRAAALLLLGVLAGSSVSAAALTGQSPWLLVDRIAAWVTAPSALPASEPSQDNLAVAAPKRARHRRQTSEPSAPAAVTVEATLAVAEQAPPTQALADVVVAEAAPEVPAVTAAPTTSVPSTGQPSRSTSAARRAPATANEDAPDASTSTREASAEDPAAWLFQAASRARAAGRHEEAVTLYDVVQRDYAGAASAEVATLAQARLWLGPLGEPARALGGFEAYLSARPDGPLAEEAQAGRIQALQRLGQPERAQQAIDELRASHPDSVYLAREPSPP